MRRQSLLWFSFVWLLILTMIGCGSSSKPTPTVAAVLPSATAQRVATTSPPPPPLITDTITLAPFQINLPGSAPVFYPTAGSWGNQLAQFQQQQPQLANYLAALAAIPAVGERVVLVHLPTAAETLTLVAAAVPSEGLTLQSYLAAAQAELEQSRLALRSGIVIQTATVRYDLHEAHLPLATLQYTLPAKGNNAGVDSSGYQAAMLDQTGTHLLLLTFVAASPSAAATQEQIETILAQLQETTPTQ